MSVGEWVHLNGQVVRAGEAAISPFDRGFLFAHAAYEVTAVHGGRMVDASGHLDRLERTLAGLDIPMPMSRCDLGQLHTDLIRANAMEEGLIYLQVTAGAYGVRDFAGPALADMTPGVFAFVTPRAIVDTAPARDGIAAVTLPDTRWARRDLKTTQLLSQALAYRKAKAHGATTAIMLDPDGTVTEAASANVWVVTAEGDLMTRDLSPAILCGITRAAIHDMAGTLNLHVREQTFGPEILRAASEVFTSSAGALILPVTAIDGQPVGTGNPGTITRRIQRAYFAHMGVAHAQFPAWCA